MKPDELISRIEAGKAPVILDVRTPGEFKQGHVPGAVNVPFNQVRKRADEILASRDEELVVYCGHGPRAYIAGALLRRMGWRQIQYLRGHWAGWTRARLARANDQHEETKN